MDNTSCINWQNCTTDLPSGSEKLVGWIPESPGRGTLSLSFNCLVTLFLCTWVVIHPRINRRRPHRLLHRLVLSFKAILAPELIAVEGAQEWTQARKMVKSCQELTQGEFEVIHAFYIGMFGLVYRTSDGARVLWPNQFIWLLEQRLLDWREHVHWGLSRQGIKDRSKADGAAKPLALFQVAWFVVQSIVRTAKHLPLAPFESMTLSYIPLFSFTYFFWWLKPKDVKTPSEIILPVMSRTQTQIFESMAISDDFDSEETRRQTSYWSIWYLTPRIFEKVEKDRDIERTAQETTKVQRAKEEGQPTSVHDQPVPSKAADEVVVSHWDPDLYQSKLLWPVTCFFGVSFPALHLISWDGAFPTVVELWLWRGAAIASMVTMLIFMRHEKVVICWRNPWTLVKVVAPILYLLSRVVMMVEAIIAFRASNPAVYETYVVWNFWLNSQ